MSFRVKVLELSEPGLFSVLVPTIEFRDLIEIRQEVRRYLIENGYKVLRSPGFMIVTEEQVGFRKAVEFSANKALSKIQARRKRWKRKSSPN